MPAEGIRIAAKRAPSGAPAGARVEGLQLPAGAHEAAAEPGEQQAQLGGRWERLKACQSDTCRWAFYDASRNRSGAWCTMESCGNRMKVRAHRRRRAETDED